MLGWL
jgi:hypothetical protein